VHAVTVLLSCAGARAPIRGACVAGGGPQRIGFVRPRAMAAPDFSAAAALADKALELQSSGGIARAGEKYRDALEAARAQRCPDCLIVARLQLDHAMVEGNILDRSELAAPEVRARRAAVVAQRLDAAATIRRRRAAGTLLSNCTAAELAWRRQTLLHMADMRQDRLLRAAAPQIAQLFGYEMMLVCASCLIDYMRLAKVNGTLHVITPEQVLACWTVIVEAVECLSQPRACAGTGLGSEGSFLSQLAALLIEKEYILPEGELALRLDVAWRRVQSTPGLLEERQMKASGTAQAQLSQSYREKAAAAAKDPGLRTCSLARCGAKEAHPSHFKSCAACRTPVYCSKEHQAEDWPSHKAACKAARKAKEAAADDESGAGPSGT
jgi:hypothetical protein